MTVLVLVITVLLVIALSVADKPSLSRREEPTGLYEREVFLKVFNQLLLIEKRLSRIQRPIIRYFSKGVRWSLNPEPRRQAPRKEPKATYVAINREPCEVAHFSKERKHIVAKNGDGSVREGDTWPEDEWQFAKSLREKQGLTYREIGIKLGELYGERTESSVKSKFYDMKDRVNR